MRHALLVSTCAALVAAGALASGCGGGGGGGGGGGAPPGNNTPLPPGPNPPNNPPVTVRKLTFVVPPTTVPVGARLLSPVQVAVQNANNATVADTRTISLTIAAANPTGVTISGTTQVAAVNGVATFADIAFTATASLTLRATATDATDAVSFPFTVGAIPASDGLGHIEDSGAMSFTRSVADDAPDDYGLSTPSDVGIDTEMHQAWVADTNNNRVVMFALGNGDDLSGVNLNIDLVLGQPDFRSRAAGTARNRLRDPAGVASDPDPTTSRLFVADRGNHRVLVFDVGTAPANGMNATHVLGQPDFDSDTPACTQTGMEAPSALAYDEATDRLYVADTGNRRVLVFEAASLVNGAPAAFVLGAADFDTQGAAGPAADTVGEVSGLALGAAGDRLFVADAATHRVTVFEGLLASIANGLGATFVLGQPDAATTGAPASPPTASSLSAPARLWHDASDRLWVADQGNARVLAFRTDALTVNNPDAESVLGQADLVTVSGAAASVSSMTSPHGLGGSGDRLWVTDTADHRALVFDISAVTDGQDALQGAGHVDNTVDMDFDRANADDAPHADALNAPGGVLLDPVGHRLFVADTANHRVLVFELSSTNDFVGVDREADLVLGQADFKGRAPGELEEPMGLALDGDRLFVADSRHHRVVVFDAANLASGAAPVDSLGQAGTPGAGFDEMNEPAGLAIAPVAQLLFVADEGNHRVLVFDVSGVTLAGSSATVVLGTGAPVVSDTGLSSPSGVAFDATGGWLFVADTGSHRVLAFDASSGLTTGMAAAHVLGQADFVSAGFGTTASTFSSPGQPAVDATRRRLYVPDRDNHRCLIFDVAALADGEAAISVLGQDSLTDASGVAAVDRMASPSAVTVGDGRVFVAELGNHRVLRFDLP